MPRHIPSLDGLRAIAVLLVLWCHVPTDMPGYPGWLQIASWWIGPGGFGVELFFALSGFLITRILIAERDAGVPVRWFLLRRMLRIFPIYYLLLLVHVVAEPSGDLVWSALYLSNIARAFDVAHGPNSLDHTWSLCVEEQFYLLWPLLVVFCEARTVKRLLLYGLFPIAVLGAAALGLTLPIPQADLLIANLSPFRFLTLAGGALLAFAEPRLMAQSGLLLRRGLLLTGTGILMLPQFWFIVLPFLWLKVTSWPIELNSTVARVQAAVVSNGLLMLCLVPGRAWSSPNVWLSAPPLRAIGRISYGLYLYHLPIFHLVFLDSQMKNGFGVLVALAATLVTATVSYQLLERPLLRYGNRFRGTGR